MMPSFCRCSPLSNLEKVDIIDEVIILTNDHYLQQFEQWNSTISYSKEIEIISDGAKSPEDQKGAIGDLHFIYITMKYPSNLLVLGGDNYLGFDILEFIKEFRKKEKALIALHDLKDPLKLSGRYGVGELDSAKKIIDFEEKPAFPKTTLASALCYILTMYELNQIDLFIKETNKADNTGDFIKYLVKNGHEIYGFCFTERWFDIGDFDQFLDINRQLSSRYSADVQIPDGSGSDQRPADD